MIKAFEENKNPVLKYQKITRALLVKSPQITRAKLF